MDRWSIKIDFFQFLNRNSNTPINPHETMTESEGEKSKIVSGDWSGTGTLKLQLQFLLKGQSQRRKAPVLLSRL